MTNFIALYRGESVATARLIAVSSEREIVEKFVRELAGDGEDAAPERARPEPLTLVRNSDE